jgi:hypothetical protein
MALLKLVVSIDGFAAGPRLDILAAVHDLEEFLGL